MGWVHIWENSNLLISGLLYTVALTLTTIITSTLLGFAVAMLRRAQIPVVGWVLRIYFEIFRGSPLLVQILFIYFGAAFMGWYGLSVFTAVVIAITLHQATYISEIFRAGLEAVPKGQREAARTLGMSRMDINRFVVLPPAMRVVLPPLFGQFISLVKNTSLASIIGAADLVRQGQGIIDRFGNAFEVFLVIAALYFVISYPMSLIVKKLERRTVRS